MKLKIPGRKGWSVAVLIGGLALVLPRVLPMGEGHHGWWDQIPGWWAWFGGIGCAVIIAVAKTLGHLFLQKPEDWYD